MSCTFWLCNKRYHYIIQLKYCRKFLQTWRRASTRMLNCDWVSMASLQTSGTSWLYGQQHTTFIVTTFVGSYRFLDCLISSAVTKCWTTSSNCWITFFCLCLKPLMTPQHTQNCISSYNMWVYSLEFTQINKLLNYCFMYRN